MTVETITTPFGTVELHGHVIIVRASRGELYDWSTRPGAHWPASDLASLESIVATFDAATEDLVDLEHSPGHAEDDEYGAELSGFEFNAWSEDVLSLAGTRVA